MNATSLSTGQIAILNVTPSSAVNNTVLRLTNTVAASASGNGMFLDGGSGTVTVQDVLSVSGLTCNPTTLGSGATTTCGVTLSAAASGASSVTVTSNNPVLGVPSAVSVAAGASSATFTATAGTVSSDQPASITASLNGNSRSTSVSLVSALGLSALTCSPSSITSGGTATCSLSLSKSAPANGASVTLSDNNSLLNTPSSVTVPAGTSSASFNATAGTIPSDQSAVITASLSGSNSVTTTLSLRSSSSFTPIRINSFGPAYTDTTGQVWSADTNFSGGYLDTFQGSIAGTSNPVLYQTARWGPSQYQFTVPNGSYSVTLKFAELYFNDAGKRRFNVVINGQTVLSDFDMVAQAGAARTAIDRTFPTTVTNGQLVIQFLYGSLDNPYINALEIRSSTTGVAVALLPTTATLQASQAQQFTASVTGTSNTSVTWSLSPPIGSVSSTGLYTAPSGISATQQVSLTARSVANTTSSATATITLIPSATVGLSSLSCSPTSLASNATSTCAVTLSGTAPSGGSLVSLSDNNSLLSTPSSVTVPAGASSVSFSATAGSIPSDQSVTITASLSGSNPITTTLSLRSSSSFTPIRINSGGPAFTDNLGQVWSADTNFSGGVVDNFPVAVSGTSNPTLYQTARGAPFQYQFTVPNGSYSVTLKFAELYFTQPGQRRFNVAINGQTVLADFDIIAQAGATRTAIDRSFSTTVTNGQMVIQFLYGSADDPYVNAVEIRSSTTAVAVALSPTTAALQSSGSQQFTASVTGTSNTAVTWSISPPIGSVSSTGLYTAPSGVSTTQQISLTARSVADTTASASATITLISSPTVSLSALSCSPTGLASNATSTCAITLSGTAPSGGTLVSLSDNNSLLTTPSSVTVPAGASSVSFNATAGSIPSDQSAVITASLSGGNSVTTTLSLRSFTPIRINSGGPAFTDNLGQLWSADANFSGGVVDNFPVTVSDTSNPTLYQTARGAPFQYQFTVPNGSYSVTLKFAELYFTQPGQRRFNVAINGLTVLADFDIIAQAGAARAAIDRTFSTTVTNGQMVIQFLYGSADDPYINALEIR